MASQVVGTAYVRLRLLTDSIGKDIEKSVKSSDLQDIDIKVNADTLKADAELKETGEEADRLGRKSPTITPKVDTKQAKKETSLLKDALVLLGPTIGPLGGAATAAFGAVAAGAGVAVVAVLGVKKQMKDATTTGVQFTSGIQKLKGDLSVLEATASRGVLPGFQTTVTALNSSLPGVNQSVGLLSRTLGDMAGHVVVGLVAGLQTFEPLLGHIALEADTAAQHFEKWATGPGGTQFSTTIGHEFDLVVPVLANLAQAAGKLVDAFLPVGNQIVGVIGALASAIDAIPLPVLQTAATLFVTLYSANRLIGMFNNLSLTLVKLGATAGTTSVRLGTLAVNSAAFARSLGIAAAAGVVVAQGISLLNNALNDSAEKYAVSDKASTNLTEAFSKSKGAIDAGVISAQQYNLQQSGLADRAAKSGISLNQLSQALVGPRKGFDQLIDTWKASGDPSAQTLDAFRELRVQMFLSQDATVKQSAAQQQLTKTLAAQWPGLRTTADSVQQLADRYHISADSVTSFASLVGISSDAIKNGVVTNKQLADSVQTVKGAYDTATMSGATFLDALQKFSTSAGTAADRAQLIGSYLKASQGDLLGYSGAVASAYQANDALTNSFKQQRDQVKANTLAIGDTERAAINLKTGLIDTSRAGAGPLIQQLQAMQDAAMNAAAATYQHERATKGAGIAAIDAANIFKNQTYNALVKDASQLGLTADQAKRLADSYFAVPGDVKTKVAAIGTDPVVAVLNQIGKQLAYLTGHPWVTKTDANTGTAQSKIATLQAKINAIRQNRVPNVDANSNAAKTQIAQLQAQIGALRDKDITIRVNQVNKVIPVGAGANSPGGGYYGSTGGMVGYNGIQRMASGGMSGQVKGPGSGTSDTAGLFALSNGEFVVNAASTKIFLPELKTINSITSRSQAAQKKAAQASASMRQLTVSSKSSVGLLHMVSGPTRKPQPVGHTATLEGYMAALVASVSHLAVAYQDRPVQLVAKDGTGLAQIVNDANLKNARRAG
jgi:hypothetical protein